MQTSENQRAIHAATSTSTTLGLSVEDAIVLSDSNRLVLRLMPCDVIARVAPMSYGSTAELEVEVARRLADTGPLAGLDPRVEPRVYVRDGFVIDMWTYHETMPGQGLSAVEYAHALERLHDGLRLLDVRTSHFMDRVVDTQQWVESREVTPDLVDADRELLVNTLANLRQSIGRRHADEQLLHGEPHPGNVLNTASGPLFIDLENCVRGPVEYDLAWVPKAVCDHYSGADQELVGELRGAVLAIIAAHRWRTDDQHPSGRQSGVEFLNALRQSPPWPTLDAV